MTVMSTCHTFRLTCHPFLLTCHTFLLTCHTFLLTCRTFLMTCHTFLLSCHTFLSTCHTFSVDLSYLSVDLLHLFVDLLHLFSRLVVPLCWLVSPFWFTCKADIKWVFMLTDSDLCWLRWLEFSRGIRGSRNITKLQREFCERFMLFPAFYACSELSLAAAATKAYACCDKTFLTTNICRDKDNFVATNTSFVATKVCLSRQTRVCFCRDKNILSRQA